MSKRLPKYVVTKMINLQKQLASGTHWSQLGGRKLYSNELRVVFELPSHYRFVCWYDGKTLYRTQAMSHERYNSIASNTRR